MAIEKEVNVGAEGKLDVKLDGGKVIISFTHVHASGQVSVVATEDAKYFLDLLKPHLPALGVTLVNLAEASLP